MDEVPRLIVDRSCATDEAIDEGVSDEEGPEEPVEVDEVESTTTAVEAPQPDRPSEQATSQGLAATYAWGACDVYTSKQFPYGVKLHIARGMLAEEIQDDRWFVKAEATVTNEHGATMEGVNVECFVSGDNENPVVESSHAYGDAGVLY